MKNDSSTTNTQPWTPEQIEAVGNRIIESRRLLEAFPDGLPAPGLLRRGTGSQSGEAEALLVVRSICFGREGDAPFRFPEDRDLSGRHYRILTHGRGVCYAEDLDSTNGLWINGRRVQTRRLTHGDQIHAGNQDFVYHDGRASEGTKK